MVGKKYKYKLLSDSPIKTVSDVRSGFIIFEDGSRIEQSRILELFDEVSNVNTNISGSVFGTMPNTEDINSILTESKGDEVVNPDTFFDDSKIINRITSEAEKLSNTINNTSIGNEGIGSRTLETTKELPVEDNPGPVKKVVVGRDDYSPQEQKKEGFQPLYTKTGEPINPGSEQIYAETNVGNALLKQMKRNKKIKLNIKLDEMIPNPSFIKMMDENFDGGVINYLVTDIVSKLLKNPTIIEKQIKDSLEELVYNKKRKTTRRKTNKSDQTSKTAQVTKKTKTKKTTNVVKKEVKGKNDSNTKIVSKQNS